MFLRSSLPHRKMAAGAFALRMLLALAWLPASSLAQDVRQVYEKDPLLCPKCGCEMKRIGFIEPGQSEVIEKILRYCGLWDEDPARAPPPPEEVVEG